MARRRMTLALAAFFGVTLLAAAFIAGLALVPAASAEEGMGACLDCHEEQGMVKRLAGGESLSLTVSGVEVRHSVHGRLGCRGCHPGVNLDEHPGDRTIASRAAYRAEVSRSCRGCHAAERLRGKPQHAPLVAGDQGVTCVECHGAHAITAIAASKAALGLNAYCLGCHARALTRSAAAGAGVSRAIDAGQMRASVHPDHACPDCHAGFSKEAHPVAGEPRRRSLSAAQACAGCHADKMRQMEGSIHFSLLRAGSDRAPGCTDCHGAHDIGPKERFANLTGMPCRGCHEEVFAAYAGSMHGRSRAAGEHFDAPLCVNCHQAHEVRGTAASAEHVRKACLGCHATAASLHADWLPNSRLHLEAISCAACHAPEAKRVIALRFVDERTGRAFSEREITGLLGGEFERIKKPAGEGLDGIELWKLMGELQRRQGAGASVNITARLEVARGLDAHRLATKSQAVRQCDTCHRAGSSFFTEVALKIADDGGRATQYPATPGLLASAASVLPLPTFYAMGSTRIGILDYLLILAVLGGLAVPSLHITARLLAARARKEGGRP